VDSVDTRQQDQKHQGQAEQQEKWHKDDKFDQIMKDLRETDPRDDKTRIQDAMGGLLRDSYYWILEHDDFQKWRSDPQSQLLWIKGDPGKGKTMLLCGIIDELEKQADNCLSYFFCQATDSRLNNATAVLRGLIYLLVDRKPSLISYVREKYDHAGKQAFEGVNAWEVLSKILASIINDPSLHDAIIVIDALDECKANRHQLLDFIKRPSRVKWVVSGRNWQDIEEGLGSTKEKVWLSLELNQDSISEAVQTYIDHKVDELALLKNYDKSTKDTVRAHLSANANGTFLWVALVCHDLADPMITRKRLTLTQLRNFPSGLEPLYRRMLKQISESKDAKECKEILAIASVVYRPITLEELKVLAEFMEQDDYDDLPQIIQACGSFLNLREGVLYFVHQSAKDFLLEKVSQEILPTGAAHQHYAIFSKSHKALSKILKRDLCKLGAPGFPIDQISPRDLEALASVRYSCVFWVDHLHNTYTIIKEDNDEVYTMIKRALQDNGDVHAFIREKYLYWLEFLSLLRSMPEGIKAVHKLEALAVSYSTAIVSGSGLTMS
jgi:nucleoside-triphosphatase THEP1